MFIIAITITITITITTAIIIVEVVNSIIVLIIVSRVSRVILAVEIQGLEYVPVYRPQPMSQHALQSDYQIVQQIFRLI